MDRPIETLTMTEAQCFLEALTKNTNTDSSKLKCVRNYALCLFMLDAGLRVGEVVRLQVSDLLIGVEPVTSLRVRAEITKTKSERFVPMSPRLLSAICSMNTHWWLFMGGQGPAFPKRFSPASPAISVRQVERIVQQYSLRSIFKAIHPHMLRHTFATNLMRCTNIRVVQELLGHRSLSSTEVYTHPNHDDFKSAIDGLGGAIHAFAEKTLPKKG